MNERLARKIATWSIGQEYGQESDEFQIVTYGILLTIESVYKTLVLIALGALLGILPETLVFLYGFCGLRLNAGGIHMKTSLGCTAVVMIGWLLSLIGILLHLSLPVCFGIAVIIFITVLLCAPVTTTNNPIRDQKTKRTKKVRALLFVVFSTIISIFLSDAYRSVLFLAMAFETLTIIPLRKEEQYEA
ncbi:MAG: accessory gene regulator B family protein [Lachnospiraceae bacterium]|nr:accessory gene regulator B family protein [Lachnospiraceae bacterium]